MPDFGAIIGMIFAAFFAIVVVAVLAPVVGELGGGLFEIAFIILAFLVILVGILGLKR